VVEVATMELRWDGRIDDERQVAKGESENRSHMEWVLMGLLVFVTEIPLHGTGAAVRGSTSSIGCAG
jgi:hypothetical protein